MIFEPSPLSSMFLNMGVDKFLVLVKRLSNLQKELDMIPNDRECMKVLFGLLRDIYIEEHNIWENEKSVENWLIKNWKIVPIFKDLELVKQQYHCLNNKFIIDILAKDSDGDYVVIELKHPNKIQQAFGQILNYMAIIEHEIGTKTRGIIFTNNKTIESIKMASFIPNVSIVELSEVYLL